MLERHIHCHSIGHPIVLSFKFFCDYLLVEHQFDHDRVVSADAAKCAHLFATRLDSQFFLFIRWSHQFDFFELFRLMQQVRASICHPTGLPVFSVYSVITSIRLFRVVLADAASARIYLLPDWTPSCFHRCSRPRPQTWREKTQIMIISFQG